MENLVSYLPKLVNCEYQNIKKQINSTYENLERLYFKQKQISKELIIIDKTHICTYKICISFVIDRNSIY